MVAVVAVAVVVVFVVVVVVVVILIVNVIVERVHRHEAAQQPARRRPSFFLNRHLCQWVVFDRSRIFSLTFSIRL